MSTKLKTLERKLGLVPKQYQPMTYGMQRLARQTDRHAPEQAPAPDLGATLDALIQQRVDEALAVERERHAAQMQQFNRPAYTDFKQVPTPPRTPTPKAMQATIQRDGAGLARAIVINGVRFLAQRDSAGQLVGVISEDMASEVAYNDQPGMVPRRLYGNTEADHGDLEL